MNELKELLKLHYNLYPKMQVTDAVKLIYQNEFGGGHLIKNPEVSLKYLTDELSGLEKSNENLIVDIGNGIVRLDITALPPDTLNKIFVASANNHKGDRNAFIEKLNLVYDLPFDKNEIDDYLKNYAEAGYPMVNHSEEYRQTYKPAYRVIEKKYVKLFDLFTLIDAKLNNGKVILGIDGKCGSGKSTIADIISEVYNSDIIHMDDFFLPPDLRTEERRNEIGGNVHYERFEEEVLSKIRLDEPFEHKVFDCSVMDYKGTAVIQSTPKDLIIVEGSYSLRFSYDINVFVDVPDEIQKERILIRDGEFMWNKFENIWIPMENAYFSEFKIKEKCDIILSGV
jgi:Uridine kinase